MYPQAPKSATDTVRWIHDQDKIAMNYLKSWFVLDFFSVCVSGFDFMALTPPISMCSGIPGPREEASDLSSLKLLRVVRVLRLIKLVRLVRSSRIMKRSVPPPRPPQTYMHATHSPARATGGCCLPMSFFRRTAFSAGPSWLRRLFSARVGA